MLAYLTRLNVVRCLILDSLVCVICIHALNEVIHNTEGFWHICHYPFYYSLSFLAATQDHFQANICDQWNTFVFENSGHVLCLSTIYFSLHICTSHKEIFLCWKDSRWSLSLYICSFDINDNLWCYITSQHTKGICTLSFFVLLRFY